MTTSGEGPESTQLKFRRKLKANLSPSLRAGVDIRGIRRSPVIPVELRIRCHYDGTRHIWDSPSAKHRYGRSECQHEAKPESIRVGGPGPSGRDWRPDGDRAPLRQNSECPCDRGFLRNGRTLPPSVHLCREAQLAPFDAWHSTSDGAVSSCRQLLGRGRPVNRNSSFRPGSFAATPWKARDLRKPRSAWQVRGRATRPSGFGPHRF